MSKINKIESVSDLHKFWGLEKPKHPLVSVYKHQDLIQSNENTKSFSSANLYQIMYKTCKGGQFTYGRSKYDFKEGAMVFLAPGQTMKLYKWKIEDAIGGWSVVFHPDLIRRSELGKQIDEYNFFSYGVNESLHISDDEKQTLNELIHKIEKEYSQNIDKHSQNLIVTNIKLILDYSMRFYDRQFYTRTNMNKDIVVRFENLLKDYYQHDLQDKFGVPTVKYCAEQLIKSPNYLSDLLKKETGRSAKDHIHFYVIEKAKTILLNTESTVSEIAYDLGFEYPQSFGKLFKNKTGTSPAEYRNLN